MHARPGRRRPRTAEGLASRAEDDALVRASLVALGQALGLLVVGIVAGELLIPLVLARVDGAVFGGQRLLLRCCGGGAQSHDQERGKHQQRTRSH